MSKVKVKAPSATITCDPALVKYVEAASESGGGQSWRPATPNEWIGGTVSGMRQVKGKWGDQTLLLLDTKGGVVSHYCNSVLQSQLEKAAVKEGDKIVVVYLGPRPSKKGRPYKLYGVTKVK
jgi:hypothetical protein